MAEFSDRDVLTRINQIQAEGGGDNPATRAQIAREAIDAGVDAAQISRALNLYTSDRGETNNVFNTGGIRVSNIASGLGYDLGAPSPLVDLGGVSNLQAAQQGLYAGDFGMPGFENIMQRLYAPTVDPVITTGVIPPTGVPTGAPTEDRPGVQTPGIIGTGVVRTTDPLYETPGSGLEYDTQTELVDPETGEFVSTGELMAQNVAQGPLTQSMNPVVSETGEVSYDYVPFDPVSRGPIVTVLPTVSASDFLFSGGMRQPELGPVNNTFAQNLSSVMQNAPFYDPLVYGDLNGDGVVDEKDAELYRSMQSSGSGAATDETSTENTAMYNRGGLVKRPSAMQGIGSLNLNYRS